MKVRMGFVSNSSSSSFVLFVKESDFEKVRKDLSGLEKSMLDTVGAEKVKAFGLNLVKISWMSGDGSVLENCTFDDVELSEEEKEKLEDEGPDSLFDEVVEKLKKFPHLENEESV